MGGPGNDYELKDCPRGQKGRGGEILKVSIDSRGNCNKAGICVIPCQHKKKS